MLTVGTLARRAGITVRTLHHYHRIGLLVPSARSEAGYRLYDPEDVGRLGRILALQRLGVPLADIAALLDDTAPSPSELVLRHLTALDRRLARLTALRRRLERLHRRLAEDGDPASTDWLTTLETITMYDPYFTADELARLPFAQLDPRHEAEWKARVAEAHALLADGVEAGSEAARQLARRWMRALERDTAGDPGFVARLNAMHEQEPALARQTGITPEIRAFITRAFAEGKLAIYRRYLDDTEYAHLRAHYFDRLEEWPPLIARFRQALDEGVPATDPRARTLALAWLELFRAYAGDRPETQAKFRLAMEREPELLEGTWLTPDLLDYLRAAVGAALQGG